MTFDVLYPEGYMCTSGDAAANAEGMGSIKAGHLENKEAQVGLFGWLLDSFSPYCA